MPLHLIGTSHIAPQSIREIRKYLDQEKPDLVAVELDVQRAAALLQEEKRKVSLGQIIHFGIKGYLFAKLGQYLQQKLGKIVGVSPGAEMKAALELAKKQKLPVAFIDQPLAITLQRFSHSLTWKEKGRFVADLFAGLLFPQRQLKKLGLSGLGTGKVGPHTWDLKKVPEPELLSGLMKELQRRYPNVYRVLVEERNKYMVRQLVNLLRKHPQKNILVVVGAGHKEGMEELLLKVEVVG
ncbi:MAG: TraB/GumN family protein [Nanoarchaeota archaeon]